MRQFLPILGIISLAGALLSAPASGALSARDSREAPILSLPPNSTVLTTHPLGVVVTYSAGARDWKGRLVPVTCTPASGTLFPLGETTVTCSATDRRRSTSTGSFLVTVVAQPAPPPADGPPAEVGEGEPRSGASVAAPVRVAWRPDPAATYYNLQLFRVSDSTAAQPEKVLSAWPGEARFTVKRRWAYDGRPYRLVPGTYRWYVWPGYGLRSERRYGPLLHQGHFVVVTRAR